jgi:hypothetical protein
MHLPCKQVYAGALPADSTNFRAKIEDCRWMIDAARLPSSILDSLSSSPQLRGTRPRNRGRSHKPVQMGVTPIPATNFGNCSGCPTVTRVSSNKPEATTGALPALPTISGSVAQLAEQPVVYGKAEGATPFGSAKSQVDPDDQGVREPSLQNKSPAFRESPGRPARGVAATFPAWNRGTAGAIPAALTTFCSLFMVGCSLQRAPVSRNHEQFTTNDEPTRCRGRNRRGIRLLNESMQVQLLPAAPSCQMVSK